MTFGNPFFESVRQKVNREAHDIRERKEELAEDKDLSETEIDMVVSDTVKRIRSELHHHEHSTDSLVSLFAALTRLAAHWDHRSLSGFNDRDKESLKALFYNAAQREAQDQAEKVEYILERYV